MNSWTKKIVLLDNLTLYQWSAVEFAETALVFLSITSIYTSENKSFDMKFVYNLTKPYMFVVYLFNIWFVFCKLLDTSYSKPGDIKLTGSALVKFDLQGVSLVHCGSLCSEDECCKEVLYNATSGRCIGSPFSDFESTLNNLVEASYDGMSKYQKGRFDLINWYQFDQINFSVMMKNIKIVLWLIF